MVEFGDCVKLFPREGDRPLESLIFQCGWGVYLGALSLFLMGAADIRSGNFGGVSYSLALIIFIFGTAVARETAHCRGIYILVGLIGNLFGFVSLLIIGYYTPIFGLTSSPNNTPFIYATAIYLATISVVFLRLQRSLSPTREEDGSYTLEVFEVNINNSWRIFQIILSLAAIVVVGIIISTGTLVLERQEVIIFPLVLFISGVLSGFCLLFCQFWYEMRFLREAYENHHVN